MNTPAALSAANSASMPRTPEVTGAPWGTLSPSERFTATMLCSTRWSSTHWSDCLTADRLTELLASGLTFSAA